MCDFVKEVGMGHVSPDELRAAFAKAGHGELAEVLIASSKPAVRIVREETSEDDIPLGSSKMGGQPDLPNGVSWPVRGKQPLAFLGQFALEDLPRPEGSPEMPRKGLLSFFYQWIDQPWGFAPEDREGWKILYWPEPGELTRTASPPGAYDDINAKYDEPFAACRVTFEVVTTYGAPSREAMGDDLQFELLAELFDETLKEGQGEDDPVHQFFGHPLVIQGPMEIECQLVSNGINCGGGKAWTKEEEARAEALEPGAADWRLLIQFDTDESGPMFGDCGMLYVWIREEDLARGEFEKAWCVLQCF